MKRSFLLLNVVSSLVLGMSCRAQVVINEIFYHAPDDLTDLQWVELYNTSDKPVKLAGWRLTRAVKFEFKPETELAPNGYAVVCKDKRLFQEYYQSTVAGEFTRSFKHNGERVELHRPDGALADSVEFSNRPPWPRGADGRTGSLERICPMAPGNLPENWTGSPLSEDATQPGGTPGAKNASFCASLPPVISGVTFPTNAILPQQSISVTAQVESKSELKQVSVLYRLVRPGSVSEEVAVPMSKTANDLRYSATIPGQEAGQVVRFRVQAIDKNSAERFCPAPTDPRPAFSALIFTNVTCGKIPVGYLIHSDPEDAQSALRQMRTGGRPEPTTPEGQGRFMAEMQFRAALDLPSLWTMLASSNCSPAELTKLRSFFREQEHERDLLQQKTLTTANPEDLTSKLPGLVTSFKAKLSESIKPLLNPEQAKLYEQWRSEAPPQGGPMGMGNDPMMMLRQFIQLEQDYLHLAVSTNVTTEQLVATRDLYGDAIQRRDSLAPELRKLMSSRGSENRDDGEKFQAKAEAIPASVEKKLRGILTPAQVRQFSNWRLAQQPAFMRHSRTKPPEPVVGQSAFVVVDPGSGQPRLFDFVRIPERSGGWKVHFGKDHSWKEMSVVDIIFESSDRWLLAEPLAYDLHHRAGLPASRTDFIRLNVDGQPGGYYLMIEQVNKAFLRHNGLRDDGNLYKANWVGNGLVGTHEKHINRHTGHDDLVHLVEQLEKTKADSDQQWAFIRHEFDVKQVLSHYAVRMLMADWDGFFNNYFLYHDVRGTGKWTLYPWDEDKTWGEYDGWQQQGVLYNMPLSYGAEGDHPPGEAAGKPASSYGFRQWWRAGGYVSRPVLANSIVHKHFMARLKQLLDTEFTEARLFPLIDSYHDRLSDEVNYRAQVTGEDVERAQKRFEANLTSFKEFLSKRRKWLLEQEEVRTAQAFDETQLK